MSKPVAGNCANCGIYRWSLDCDHIVPRWKGGTDEPTNLQRLCQNCHKDKSREDQRGFRHSEETRSKLRAKTKKRFENPEARAKLSQAHTGKKLSQEHCEKMREAGLRRWEKPGEREKHGADIKRRLANPEVRKKISDRIKAHYADNPEAREKLSTAIKGRRYSEETKQNMRQSALKSWNDRPDRRLKVQMRMIAQHAAKREQEKKDVD